MEFFFPIALDIGHSYFRLIIIDDSEFAQGF